MNSYLFFTLVIFLHERVDFLLQFIRVDKGLCVLLDPFCHGRINRKDISYSLFVPFECLFNQALTALEAITHSALLFSLVAALC